MSTSRYDQLIEYVHVYKPRSIIEVGVNKGDRAILLCKAALQYHPSISYRGYDLFESATDEINKAEMNGKSTLPQDTVRKRLEKELDLSRVDLTIIPGNTRETLKSDSADFVWLDGGHSVETIQNDYNAVAKSRVIVMDDFYSIDEHGKSPDISRFGCNSIVSSISHAQIITPPTPNRVRGGGLVSIVLIDNSKERA